MRENRSENSEIYAEDISFSTKNYFVLEDINWKIEKDNVGDSRAQRCGKNDTKLFSFRLAEAEQRCST